ncbi:MAG: hypothetical protein GY721_02970, partial [Deltaproteobacteria bacterium]|nr:hypothetical protein [Deltaproteobacteria bacterium]
MAGDGVGKKMKLYMEKLESVSDEELESTVVELVAVETRSIAMVIAHLSEIYNGSTEFKEKFERFAEVIGVGAPHGCIVDVLESAIEIALEKKDPIRKRERQLKREEKKKEKKKEEEVVVE